MHGKMNTSQKSGRFHFANQTAACVRRPFFCDKRMAKYAGRFLVMRWQGQRKRSQLSRFMGASELNAVIAKIAKQLLSSAMGAMYAVEQLQ